MQFQDFLFYFFAIPLIVGAIGTIVIRNTAKAAFFLILAFFSSACLWILLQAEFLAITLILVYVGAVMVLFLFVIRNMNIVDSARRARFTPYLPLGIMVAVVVVIELGVAIWTHQFSTLNSQDIPELPEGYSNIKYLATLFYTSYVFPFELAALLLLVAIYAAITLVHRPADKRKTQQISKQIAVRAQDRMRIATEEELKSFDKHDD